MTINHTIPQASNAELADRMGALRAEMNALKAQMDEIKDELTKRGIDHAEGSLFAVTRAEYDTQALDTTKIRKYLTAKHLLGRYLKPQHTVRFNISALPAH